MSTEPKQRWKKTGWRSLRHQGFPRLLVRFRSKVPHKVKFLLPDGEMAFNTSETSQGRDPAASLAALVKEAQEFWDSLPKQV
jgi:hypothetical protein